MNQEITTNQTECPRIEIAAYIDGELSPREELDLEMHFAVCPTCSTELNEQKKLLCALDFALENEEEIELPENFTKVIVANAESNVQGLRCPRERNRALMVCAALFILIFIGLGAETSQTFASVTTVTDKLFAVGSFFVHLVHDISIAAAVIFRSVFQQFVFKSTLSAVLIGICFVVSFLIFSRLMSRHRRF